jgi:stage II sporulation protein AA (anti-sigma F factor antagonist)
MVKYMGQGGINMSIKLSVKGEVVTAYLGGELDHHSAREMREAIDNAIEMNIPSLLVLDFSGVTFMDSSGIGLVMGHYRLVSGNGKKIKVNNLSKRDYTIMKMSGIEKLAEINQRNEVFI